MLPGANRGESRSWTGADGRFGGCVGKLPLTWCLHGVLRLLTLGLSDRLGLLNRDDGPMKYRSSFSGCSCLSGRQQMFWRRIRPTLGRRWRIPSLPRRIHLRGPRKRSAGARPVARECGQPGTKGAAMAADIEQTIIRHSVQDVIRILENEPVRPDFIGQITAVQIMNRVSIAHLSIERALKFLITRAGGPLTKDHHLGDRLRELLQYEPNSADFLIHAFQAAVRHYRFNPNVHNAEHLKSLESYLDDAGSDRAFQDLRYWELHQSPDEILLRRLYLALHMELLRAVFELLRGRTPNDTVETRLERAVEQAMWLPADLASAPGTPKEDSVRSYIEWRRGFASWSEALADAGRQEFMIGDEFANGVVVKARQTLLQSADPAISYFAGTLDVLPKQPRAVTTQMEWIDTPPQQRGFVNSPSGVTLGEIERRWDGLWSITPFQSGLVTVTARAASQTDAQCYLAALFSRIAEITVNGEERPVRIVANEETLPGWNMNRFGSSADAPTEEATWSHQVDLWETDHGIMSGDRLTVRVRSRHQGALIHVLEGVVKKVEKHEVYLYGNASYDVADQGAE